MTSTKPPSSLLLNSSSKRGWRSSYVTQVRRSKEQPPSFGGHRFCVYIHRYLHRLFYRSRALRVIWAFGKPELEFLGYTISYKVCIPHAAQTEKPLNGFLIDSRKNDKRVIPWTDEASHAFEQVKKYLTNANNGSTGSGSHCLSSHGSFLQPR